ncbi:MAG TPA: glycosyltransferase family 2 protein [Candidatus Lachnoclostridium stercorigallinarum]|uniref:Glycosyltransferase family 2 protein n=1 Tax=Candidatus Lachnoclostridium stercorigallinarum TaxID=2838634 RepID=A0A9D2GIH9_9FIRM|nr:glycosyltransferase family 2 protein [Candidatus Lachnoclostridium stercorigallinarum]
MLTSLIIPCYNEEDVLPLLWHSLETVTEELREKSEFEFIFVDDGSKDGTLKKIKELALEDSRVTYLSFSRNFGKEAAMYAGLCNAKGDYAAIMDADMQDPPSLLPEMFRLMEEGYDSVAARRVSRAGEPKIRSLGARLFYRLINRISDADIVDGARDFRLMKREMVDAVVAMSEYHRFSKGIFGWVGFKTCWLPYENVERAAGETKWSFWGLLKYSVEGMINFSQAPLSIASWCGIGLTGVSFVMILFIIVRKLLFGDPVAGWPSLACIIVFLGGIELLCMGIMGQYLAKTYMEVKGRPHCIVGETNREDAKKIL